MFRSLIYISFLTLTGAAVSAQTLSYTEKSNGLQTPDMEAGRTEIEFADVDNDGNVDLVSIGDHGSPHFNASEHGIMVWFGDGNGNWSAVQYGEFGYGGVALGDVNNDGFLDAAYGYHHNYFPQGDLGDQILEVALGNGTGLNWMPWDDGLATNGEDWGMFGTDLADVDLDGLLDVGSISFGCCAGLHVYRNNGDGSWTQTFGFLNGNSLQDFTFGDINGDGFPDIAAAHGNGTVYLGDGTGDFTLADGNLSGGPLRSGPSLGDVNDDGRDDLAFINNGGIKVFSLVSPGNWQDLSGNLPASGGYDLTQIADMNLDGHGDILAFRDGSSSPGEVAVFAGDGTGNWQQIASITTAPNDDYAAFRAGVDCDHNGYPDVVVIQEEYVGGLPIAWRNRPRLYAESSHPDQPFLFPAYPRGGETFIAGSVRFLMWHAAIPDDAGNPGIKLEVSTHGPGGPFTLIADNLPDNGNYQWLISDSLPSSDNCCIRITLDTQPPLSVVTPEPFSIVNPNPSLPGDLDGDCDVDQADLGLLLASYLNDAGGDLDGDGDTDQADLGILLANYGQSC